MIDLHGDTSCFSTSGYLLEGVLHGEKGPLSTLFQCSGHLYSPLSPWSPKYFTGESKSIIMGKIQTFEELK